MPRPSRIFHNLRKLKIALDVDRDVIDGDFGSNSGHGLKPMLRKLSACILRVEDVVMGGSLNLRLRPPARQVTPGNQDRP